VLLPRLAVPFTAMRELPRIGAELAGYRLESALARGGMAVVFVAEDIRLGRKVALKILAPELAENDNFRERFLRESRIAASLDHPNVIPIYDAGEADGFLYIAMRLVEDTDLRGLLREEGALELERGVGIVTQVAGALGAAHRKDLVHRDVKPANVLLIRRQTPNALDHCYLSDFGLAKHVSSVSGLTATGKFLGTVSYCAPEQVEGKSVDARTDIYALGCVLFEVLAGRPPFKKEEDLAVVMAHIKDEPPSILEFRDDCPPAIASALARMLAKDSRQRIQSCEEVIEELRAPFTGPRSVAPDATLTSAGVAPIPAGALASDSESEQLAAAPPEPPASPPPSDPGGTSGSGDGPTAPRRGLPGGRRALLALGLVAACVMALVLLLGRGGGPVPLEDAVAPLAWASVANSSVPRQQAASAVHDGKLWVLGGLTGRRTASTGTTKVEAYDPVTDTWTEGPELPVALHHAMAADYDGELVVMGGWVPEGADLTASTSDKVYALRDDEWVELPSMPAPRAAGAAAAVGDELVVVGGQAAEQLVAPIAIFDGKRWREGTELPTPREHLAAVSDGGSVYAVGGRELSADTNTAAFERYDPETDEWTELPAMPTPAGSLGAGITSGHLIAVGGETPTSVIDSVQSYDLESEEWTELPPLTVARHGAAVGAMGSSLYVLDGAIAPTHAESTGTGESLDLSSAFGLPPDVGEWRALRDSPTARQQTASAVLGGRVWVLGGLVGEDPSDVAATTKVEAYDPAIDTWTAGPELPLPLHHAMAVTYNGELVVMGGWVPDGSNLTATTSDKAYALRDGSWVELPNMPIPRAAGAAAVADDRIVVAGGQSGGELVPATAAFDGNSWKDAADIPTPREHLAAASDGGSGYVYAVGGRELSADQNSGALERYDPATDAWEELPPMPTPSGSLGAAVVERHLVTVGGEDPASIVKTVQSYDIRTQKWAELPDMLTPRHGAAVVGVGQTLYALDGAEAPTHAESTAAAEALDFR
jgi:non-specific serine/threonine protein kinase